MKAIIDAHVHFRQDELSKKIIPYSSAICEQVIAMPNTNPPLQHIKQILEMQAYYQNIAGPQCKVHMTAKLLPTTAIVDIKLLAKNNLIVGYKLYPCGVTSNSSDGIPSEWIKDPPKYFLKLIETLEDSNLVLLHHGEHPDYFCMDRELRYLDFVNTLRHYFPNLKMTLEHITTKDAVDFVNENHNILGTITLHHLYYTLDDVIGNKLQAHLFCKPIPKKPQDRLALMDAIDSVIYYDNSKFAFGSDSAPWTNSDKYCKDGCAGVFSAPILIEGLKTLFPLNDLNNFTRLNAAKFYELDLIDRDINIIEEEWKIPESIWLDKINGKITPMFAGETLRYKRI